MNVGDVVRVHTTLSTPPKHKIVLCIGTHFGNELFLWFNTEPRQRPAQMAVARREVPGISHDCFLDCGRATMFPPHELAAAKYCGRAPADFLLKVADEIALRASTLTTGQRNSIARALGPGWN